MDSSLLKKVIKKCTRCGCPGHRNTYCSIFTDMSDLFWEEIAAATTMVLPSIVALPYFLSGGRNARIAAFGCMVHFPFSFALHLHRAVSSNLSTRTWLYKLDVIFIHFYALCHGYSWTLQIQWLEIVYHIACVLHIWMSDPLVNPSVKHTVDILAGIGTVKSSLGIILYDFSTWDTCMVWWIALFVIHNRKIFGQHSSWMMHVMLSVPENYMLHSLENLRPTTWSAVLFTTKENIYTKRR